ncbi:MAG: hypothetical protein ACEB74_12700 [Desulfovibrio aminophilus]|jgi:hypothetical protein|uniref:hypothetical protein n=1 Tax=Desulfovibrio aminophilus TaxID=81425 RepID=UPI002A4CAE29|nr:hypothetical protein [Desulfovibrionaceae bacterium]
MKRFFSLAGLLVLLVALSACTQETQNKLSRGIQNWTGVDGVLEVYAGNAVAKRFLKIEKLSTAEATGKSADARSYRYGYGVLDANLNGLPDPDEKKVYFEVSEFATYVFYENPNPSK